MLATYKRASHKHQGVFPQVGREGTLVLASFTHSMATTGLRDQIPIPGGTSSPTATQPEGNEAQHWPLKGTPHPTCPRPLLPAICLALALSSGP